MTNNSKLTGAIDSANTAKETSISLDSTSSWIVTADSHVNTITAKIAGNTVANITGNGHNVYYTSSSNSSLEGKTYSLINGGQLIPE